jgi:hypothetical protein
MTRRLEYRLRLEGYQPVGAPIKGIIWRHPVPDDKQIVANLMLDAYRGTIDDDGETIEDALNEVQSYFSKLPDAVWLKSSWLAFINDELVCACLVGFWRERNAPLIAYIMTGSRWKGNHFATNAVARSLQSLSGGKHTEVLAVITQGNLSSEKIFMSLGFMRLTPD